MLPAEHFIRVLFNGLGSTYLNGMAFTITSSNGLLVAGEVMVNVHYA